MIPKTTIVLLSTLLIWSCKNEPKSKKETISQQYAQREDKNPIYDLIIRKKETGENLATEFSYDSISSLTEHEKSNFKKTGLENGDYLTSMNFLEKAIDSIDFKVYYKISYGSELEKLVRIKREDTVFDLSLAFTGGDGGQSWLGDTQFLNDSIFQKINVFTETAIDNTHLMAYNIDSIITKYQYDSNLNFREIKKDSFRVYKEFPTYHKNLKDSIFKTWSDIFKVNGIDCRWEYEVKYTDETNENSKALLVNLVSQKLHEWRTKDLMLELDLSKFAYIPPKNISKLEYNKYPNSSIDKIKDVNSDGFTDIQFVTERAGAGANIAYATYLFNKTDKMFEYSDVFSDYNIEYDSIKNRTSSFMKSGFGNYYYQFKNLNENRKDVEFVENVHHAADTIFYTKMVNEKIISEKKIVLKEYEDWKKYLERN